MKKITKHILLLALMLFGVAGAAWAQQHKLDSIPTTWQVRVNGVAQTVTAYTAGNKQKGHIDNIIENYTPPRRTMVGCNLNPPPANKLNS